MALLSMFEIQPSPEELKNSLGGSLSYETPIIHTAFSVAALCVFFGNPLITHADC